MFRNRWILIAAALSLPLMSACGDDADDARSVVEFSSVAENGVFVCGIWDAGGDKAFPTDDDFIPAGHVPVTLKNRSYNEYVFTPEFSPYGDFHVTEIAVNWYPIGPDTPIAELRRFDYSAQYDVIIPKDSEISFNVMIVPFAMKSDTFFANLVNGGARGGDGSTPPFTAVARMQVRGHDSGDERLVTIEGAVIVEFIGVVIGE